MYPSVSTSKRGVVDFPALVSRKRPVCVPIVAAVVAAFVLSACDTTQPSLHVPEPVVEAYLVAGELLPQVRLSWTQDITRPYSASELALSDANVVIHLLDESGSPEVSFEYGSRGDGAYRPPLGSSFTRRVLPEREYRLEVTLQDGTEVTSSTRVPGDFQFLGQNAEALEYQSAERLETRVTRSAYPGRSSIFVFTIEALEPTIENLTPFYLRIIYHLDPEDDLSDLDLLELEEVRITASPPLNEANYESEIDGSLTVWLPWFAVAFFGPNRVGVNAIDDNIDQYMRFQQAQQGGSLAPGEIPNVIDAVEGGRGVFGSMTRISVNFDVLRAGQD